MRRAFLGRSIAMISRSIRCISNSANLAFSFSFSSRARFSFCENTSRITSRHERPKTKTKHGASNQDCEPQDAFAI